MDEYGCPFDSDGDGVPDHLDRCPDTPYEIQVDKNGCPMDEDLDGVPDHLDQCPGTLPGVQVDENGCELVIAPPPPPVDPNQLILNSETSFEFNSAQLKPAAFPELDKMLEQMKNIQCPAGELKDIQITLVQKMEILKCLRCVLSLY